MEPTISVRKGSVCSSDLDVLAQRDRAVPREVVRTLLTLPAKRGGFDNNLTLARYPSDSWFPW